MAESTVSAVLKANGLKKQYRSVRAVDGVDLVVKPGECLALLGPNGAGKTTTVEMLEGLTSPDAGSIEILGMPLASKRSEIMERVGVLLQETYLYKRYTIRESLELFSSFFAKSLSPATIMSWLQLEEKADVQLRHLSGGQKQRVYLGCALINDPALLFLDEPTTGLDPQARRHIWDLLSKAKKDGRSILLTTHYMEEAQYLADRVAIIDHGKIIAEGSPRQLIQQVCGGQMLWVAFDGLDSSLNDGEAVKHRLTQLLPWFAAAGTSDGGFELATETVPEHVQALFAAALSLGLSVKRLEIREGTLEDVFLKLTGRSMRDG